jgi:iron complex outermembrane receptor protein
MRTDIYTNAVNAPTNHIGGYTPWNARIAWRPEQGNWETSLLALNLTDHFYYRDIFGITDAGGGSVTGYPGAGRARGQAQILVWPLLRQLARGSFDE